MYEVEFTALDCVSVPVREDKPHRKYSMQMRVHSDYFASVEFHVEDIDKKTVLSAEIPLDLLEMVVMIGNEMQKRAHTSLVIDEPHELTDQGPH